MINWVELRLGCRGLAHLARFDGQFLRFFDRSSAGALRSFQLALWVFPFYLLLFWLEIDAKVPDVVRYLAGRTVGYAYNWITFPLILFFAGRLLDRDAETPGCIAIYNWLALIWIVFQLPLLLLFTIDQNSFATSALGYLFLFYSILIEGYLLMRALRIVAWQAAVLVVVDVGLNIYVIGPFSRVLGGAVLP